MCLSVSYIIIKLIKVFCVNLNSDLCILTLSVGSFQAIRAFFSRWWTEDHYATSYPANMFHVILTLYKSLNGGIENEFQVFISYGHSKFVVREKLKYICISS